MGFVRVLLVIFLERLSHKEGQNGCHTECWARAKESEGSGH